MKTLLAATLLLTAALSAKPNGVEALLGATGGPFPGETSCANAMCHGGEPNSGPGGVFLTVNDVPLEDYRYIPNETVEILVRIADPAQGRWGYQITARPENDLCANAGQFSQVPGSMVRTEDDPIGECGPGLQFGLHLLASAGPNEATFKINWTAPATDVGPVLFAAAGNAANGNTMRTGDNIYTTLAKVEAPEPEPLPRPEVSQGAVILASLNPLVDSVSPNALVSVFGASFAAPGTVDVQPTLDAQGRVAAVMAGTCVEMNGVRAPLFAVLDSQINFQAPSNLVGVSGPVNVEVIQRCDTAFEQRSTPVTVNAVARSPAFFVFPQFGDADGANPIATLLGGGPVVIAPTGLFEGAGPAPGGEFVSFFATGLGATDPFLQAGEIPQSVLPAGTLARLTGAFSLTVGGITVPPEDVFFVGAAPCCAGLYQITAKLPELLPTGDHEVIATVNGISTPEGPFVPIQAQ